VHDLHHVNMAGTCSQGIIGPHQYLENSFASFLSALLVVDYGLCFECTVS
jgi:hypothetical protein